MKSIILYASQAALDRGNSGRCNQVVHFAKDGVLFIRTEVVEGDPSDALDMAKPARGEIVLNTVPADLENWRGH